MFTRNSKYIYKDIRQFDSLYCRNHTLQICKKYPVLIPFVLSFVLAWIWWILAAVYSLSQGTFGWWTKKVDVPFTAFWGCDLINAPILIPISLIIVIHFYTSIPNAYKKLFDEGLITDIAIKHINNFINKKINQCIYRTMKVILLSFAGALTLSTCCYWCQDELTGWGDPQFGSFNIGGIFLNLIPLTAYVLVLSGFFFDQIFWAIINWKLFKNNNLKLNPTHPDKHFGLEPLSKVANLGMYFVVICGLILLFVVFTGLSFRKLDAVFGDFGLDAAIIFFTITFPIIILAPVLPIYLYTSKCKEKFLSDTRIEIASNKETVPEKLFLRYDRIKSSSPIILKKAPFFGYILTIVAQILLFSLKHLLQVIFYKTT